MSAMEKFVIRNDCLIVGAPFLWDERQTEEEAFLRSVDVLLKAQGTALVIDLVCAGSISSTVIALAIAAHRKAEEVGKTLSLRIARRNALAIRISGLDKLLPVELV